ncbi:MAG: hydrogenase maturation protease [Chloroflexota bacterium]
MPAGPTRVLCLGNELIADDGVGPVVGRLLGERLAREGTPAPAMASVDPAVTVRVFELSRVGTVELVETALTGMYLLDSVVGAARLIVVDSVVTGAAEPGTVLELRERDLDGPRGSSPHYIGLLETLDLARALGLGVPADIVIVAVEAGDYWTVGGPMTDRVGAAVSVVVDRTMDLIGNAAPSTAAGAAIGGTLA